MDVNVYNRWGALVYHSDNYNNDWDGTYQGKPLPDATYYYVIQVTYPGGNEKTFTGNVTIIR
jgi:gliding motility-associated-like protein